MRDESRSIALPPAGQSAPELLSNHQRLAVRRLGLLAAATSAGMARVLWAAGRRRWSPGLAAREAQRWACRLTEGLGIDVTRHGALPEGPVLLVGNHRSYIDIAALLSLCPASFLAKSELASWPLLGPAARLGNTLFVERESKTSRRAARNAVARRLGEGVPVVVFPEGTTTAGPGLLPFRPGIFATAAEAGITVVPVAVEYHERSHAWVDDDSFIPHFMRVFGAPAVGVEVSFGPALNGRDCDSLRNASWQWIDAELKRLANGTGRIMNHGGFHG